MNDLKLDGLSGTNPLGFLAALGILSLFHHSTKQKQPSLWWSNDLIPRAIVDNFLTADTIAELAESEFVLWADSISRWLEFSDHKSSKASELKLTKDDMRKYFKHFSQSSDNDQRILSLMACLIAEGSLDDNNSVSKPTDLYFTAGQQKFLGSAQQIFRNVSREDIIHGLNEPWRYDSDLPSLMWDVSDARDYALRAKAPGDDNKMTNPGPEALAILGLSLYPVFGNRNRTLTTGCSGNWKHAYFSWPLWHKPARYHTVKSLVSQAHGNKGTRKFKNSRDRWFRSWGVSQIYGAQILRSDKGGYGTFSPPEIIWQSS